MAGVKPLLETIGALLPKVEGGGIKAWHASPYDFSKFDLAASGSGQGASMFGKGIYAAESPAVSGVGGQYWQEFSPRVASQISPRGYATDAMLKAQLDRDRAISHLEDEIRSFPDKVTPRKVEALEMLKRGDPVGAHVYELNIKAQPDQFLDWYKPLALQSDQVIDKLSPIMEKSLAAQQASRDRVFKSGRLTTGQMNDLLDKPVPKLEEATGEQMYKRLGLPAMTADTGKAAATAKLQELDIPGIRYLDQVSRGGVDLAALRTQYQRLLSQLNENKRGVFQSDVDAAKLKYDNAAASRSRPTYNYVLNNPDIIEIMRKLAIPGIVGASGAATAYQPQGQQ